MQDLTKGKQLNTKHGRQKVGLQSSKPKQNEIKTPTNDWQWGDENEWREEEPGTDRY